MTSRSPSADLALQNALAGHVSALATLALHFPALVARADVQHVVARALPRLDFRLQALLSTSGSPRDSINKVSALVAARAPREHVLRACHESALLLSDGRCHALPAEAVVKTALELVFGHVDAHVEAALVLLDALLVT